MLDEDKDKSVMPNLPEAPDPTMLTETFSQLVEEKDKKEKDNSSSQQ